MCLTVSSLNMRTPLLTFWEKNLRRVAVGANREKIIVLAKKQKLVSITRQRTVIQILPLIELTLRMNSEELRKMTMRATLDGDVYNRLK